MPAVEMVALDIVAVPLGVQRLAPDKMLVGLIGMPEAVAVELIKLPKELAETAGVGRVAVKSAAIRQQTAQQIRVAVAVVVDSMIYPYQMALMAEAEL